LYIHIWNLIFLVIEVSASCCPF